MFKTSKLAYSLARTTNYKLNSHIAKKFYSSAKHHDEEFAVKEINKDNFYIEVLQESQRQPILLEFYKGDDLGAELERMVSRNRRMAFGRVNLDENKELAEEYDIENHCLITINKKVIMNRIDQINMEDFYQRSALKEHLRLVTNLASP